MKLQSENRCDCSIWVRLLLTALLAYTGGSVHIGRAQGESPSTPTAFTVDSSADRSDTNPGDGVCRADNGLCTLRAAVEESSARSGADTIILPAMTFVLTQNRDLTIPDRPGDDSLTITGAGEGATIIDGNGTTRIFNFEVFTGSHSLSNMTLRNADNRNTGVKSRNGGGIFNEATLRMTRVTVANCQAYQGGGVYNEYAFGNAVPELHMIDVTLVGNYAKTTELGLGGGGLFNGSKLNGNGILITANAAAIQGGGFYNNSFQAEMVLRNFTITGNTARLGAGINNDLTYYPLVLEDGTISDNVANCCHPGNNAATGGAGIYNNQAKMRLTNVDIRDNRVPDTVKGGGYGAGVVNIQFMDLYNVSLTGNQSTYGAAIYNGNYNGEDNQLTLTNVTISGNAGPAGFPDSEAAGIYSVSGAITIVNSTITLNQAEVTGGIKNTDNRTAIAIKNTIVAGNLDNYTTQDCRGTFTSLGGNILGNPRGSTRFPCTVVPSGSPADQLGVVPSLLPLMGSPAFHPLAQSSTAVDRGANSGCPAQDVAGHSRPFGQSCDIGSFEWNSQLEYRYIYLPLTLK